MSQLRHATVVPKPGLIVAVTLYRDTERVTEVMYNFNYLAQGAEMGRDIEDWITRGQLPIECRT